MDTAVLAAILASIVGILTTVGAILGTLYKCGKDITLCFGCMRREVKEKEKDIENERIPPIEHEMEPEVDAPPSGSSHPNVTRDSLIKIQHMEILPSASVSLMTLLSKCLQSDIHNSVSILSGHVDHFQSNKSENAVLGWGCGCGWRNIQMLSSHLLRQRREARDVLYGGSGFVPDIASLQRWLELAWADGFDTQIFDRRYNGNVSWIETKECAALLRYFGLRANVVEFKITNSSSLDKNGHHHVLTEWVWNYFSDNKINRSSYAGDRVIVSEKAPLYFHHDGHSRTIVGIQAIRFQTNGMQQLNLLIFEPHIKTEYLKECLIKNVGWEQKIKRGSNTLKKPLYQLCYVDSGIASGEDLENLKTITSIRPEC